MNVLEPVDNLLEDLESRMPYLVAQYPEHTEDSIRKLAPYDPGNGKYMAWILKSMREFGAISPEYGAGLRQDLERFEQVKRLSNYTGRKDINQFGSFDDLHAEMEQAKDLMSRGEQERSLRRIATYKDYTLYRITTEQAAKKFAQNSALCFVGDYYARRYVTEQPPLFGVMQGGQAVAALHPQSDQYKDMRNRPVEGDLKRTVLRLAKASHEPVLLAYYEQEFRRAVAQAKAARVRRAQERRRAMLRNFNRAGRAPLGEAEGYQLFAVRRNRIEALLPEDAREGNQPVLLVVAPSGEIVALVDAEKGKGLDGHGNQLEGEAAALAGRVLRDWLPEVTVGFAKEVVFNAQRYAEQHALILQQLHDRFMDERLHGFTDPRNGIYRPPITRQEALQRWEVALPKFEEALLSGHVKLQLPGIGFARVAGFEGEL